MGWARFDDQFPHHPKVAALGILLLPCVGLHVMAVCYANAYLTDGILPADEIPRLAGDVAKLLPEGHPWGLVERLVEVGIWEEVEDGYMIHDFLEYNPSKRDVMQRRKIRAVAGHRGGLAKALANTKQRASMESGHDEASEKQKAAPSPSPSPSPKGETTEAHATAPAAPSPAPVPPSILRALERAPRLGAVPRLTSPQFWSAIIRATNGAVDYAGEILKAEAWLVANPSRAPRKDLGRFLHNWLGRAAERSGTL